MKTKIPSELSTEEIFMYLTDQDTPEARALIDAQRALQNAWDDDPEIFAEAKANFIYAWESAGGDRAVWIR